MVCSKGEMAHGLETSQYNQQVAGTLVEVSKILDNGLYKEVCSLPPKPKATNAMCHRRPPTSLDECVSCAILLISPLSESMISAAKERRRPADVAVVASTATYA